MARSLFGKLNRRFGRSSTGQERHAKTKARVQALRDNLPANLLTPPSEPPSEVGSVAVVGAGFAGLVAATFLSNLGYRVQVFEARDRVGGRVHTLTDFATGRLIEGGAELIGLNHPLWISLALDFGLAFSVVTPEDDFAGVGLQMPLRLGGELLPPAVAEEIWECMGGAFDTLVDPAKDVDPYQPWTAPNAPQLDQMPLSVWKDDLSVSDLCKAAIEADLGNNNAEPTSRQSFLANLALVAGGGGESFWTETEVFRCATGNQSLAENLASQLEERQPGSVSLTLPVTEIHIGDSGVTVVTAGSSADFDYAILAVPPSTWPQIAIDPPIPPEYVMNVGPTVKFLTVVDERFWILEEIAPSGMDDQIGETWEGTDNQMLWDSQGLELSVFAGGDAARKALEAPDPNSWFAGSLDVLFPGYSAHRRDTRFMAWPREPWTLGGYSCPLPGQVTTVAPRLAQAFAGRLFFAGEHTCPAFFGYMEGALQSGLLATGQIAEAVGMLSHESVVSALRAAVQAG